VQPSRSHHGVDMTVEIEFPVKGVQDGNDTNLYSVPDIPYCLYDATGQRWQSRKQVSIVAEDTPQPVAAMAKLERLVIGNEPLTEAEQHEDFASGNEVATGAADATPAAIQ